jgi:predicted unusual protein kinase regulating ubiquinone biosynthesis (AarF/ABC1/UbiB family)
VVAVKCQYPRLYHQTESDIWTITQLAKLIGLLFKVNLTIHHRS